MQRLLDKEQKAFSKAESSYIKHHKTLKETAKATKIFKEAGAGLLKIVKYGAIELGGMTLVLGGLKLALVAGQLVMKAFNASLTGLGAAAGIAVGALGAVLAAVRELKAAQMAPLLKSVAGTMPGVPVPGKGSYKSSTGVIGNMMADKRFGMFSDAALTGMMSARAQAGQRVDAPFRNQLARLADFSGGDEKTLTSINQAMINGAKAGKVTGEVYQELQKSAPALAKAFQEMTGGEEAATKAADAGTMSFDKFNEAIMKGELEALKPYNGALNEINNTVMGKLKGGLRTLKEDLTDLGSGEILDAVRAPIDGIVATLHNSIIAVSGSIQSTFPKLLGGVGGVTTNVMETVVKYIVRGMTSIRNMGDTLNNVAGKIREFFSGVAGYLTQVTGPFDQFANTVLKPLGSLLLTFINDYIKGFGDALNGNQASMAMWGDALSGLTEFVHGFVKALNIVKRVMAPIVGVFLQIINVIGQVLNSSVFGGIAQFALAFGLIRLALNKSISVFQKWKAKLIETFSALQRSKAEMDAAKASMDPLQRALDMVNKRISEQVALLKQATNEWRQMMQFQQLALPGGKPQPRIGPGGGRNPFNKPGGSPGPGGIWRGPGIVPGIPGGPVGFGSGLGGAGQGVRTTGGFNAGNSFGFSASTFSDTATGANNASLRKSMRDRIMSNRLMVKAMNTDAAKGLRQRLGYYREFHKSMYEMDRKSATPFTLKGMKDWARQNMPAGSRESRLAAYRQTMSNVKANGAIIAMTAGGMMGGGVGGAISGAGMGAMMGQMTGTRYGTAAGAIIGGGLAAGGMVKGNDKTNMTRNVVGSALQYGATLGGAGLMVPGVGAVTGAVGAVVGATVGVITAVGNVLDARKAELEDLIKRDRAALDADAYDFDELKRNRQRAAREFTKLKNAQEKSDRLGYASRNAGIGEMAWRTFTMPLSGTGMSSNDAQGRQYIKRGNYRGFEGTGQIRDAEIDLQYLREHGSKQEIKNAEERLSVLKAERSALDEYLKNNKGRIDGLRGYEKEVAAQEKRMNANYNRGLAFGIKAADLEAWARRNGVALNKTKVKLDEFVQMLGYSGEFYDATDTSRNSLNTLSRVMEDLALSAQRSTAYITEQANVQKTAAEESKKFNRVFADYLAALNQPMTPEDATIGAADTVNAFADRTGSLLTSGVYGQGFEGFKTYLSRLREGGVGILDDATNRPGAREENLAPLREMIYTLIAKINTMDLPAALQLIPNLGTDLQNFKTMLTTNGIPVNSEEFKDTATAWADRLNRELGTSFTGEQIITAIKGDGKNAIVDAHAAGGKKAAAEFRNMWSGLRINGQARVTKDGLVLIDFNGASIVTKPNGDGKPGDTSSPRRQFAKSMASHSMFNSMIPGSRNILSGLRSTGLGSPSSDHRFGYAYDLTGQNLGAYASLVKASGGFAEFHGAAGDRHLHVVPPHGGGDTMTPMRSSVAVPSTGGGAVVNNSYSIVVNGGAASPAEIADEVMMRIRRAERNAMERA